MKYIKKSSPPEEFVSYKQLPGSTYKDLVENHHDIYEIVRLSLAEEQGYICCYCGQRITGFEGTQIEHVFPKGTVAYEKMQLDYETNLIASCDGGKYKRKIDATIPVDDLHCDTKKHQDPIPVTPLNPLCEDKFLFDINGDIIGIGADAEATIEILNLKSPILKNMRKAAIDYYLLFPPTDWNEELEKLKQKNSNNQFTEFCFVLRSYIEIFHSAELREPVAV